MIINYHGDHQWTVRECFAMMVYWTVILTTAGLALGKLLTFLLA